MAVDSRGHIVLETLDELTQCTLTGPQGSVSVSEEATWASTQNASAQGSGFNRMARRMFVWTMDLGSLDGDEFQELELFFAAVGGNRDTFHLTHTDGVTYTVQFWGMSPGSCQLVYRRVHDEHFTVTLIFLSPDQPNGALGAALTTPAPTTQPGTTLLVPTFEPWSTTGEPESGS